MCRRTFVFIHISSRKTAWGGSADVDVDPWRYIIAPVFILPKLMHLSAGIPILRIFSKEKAKEFYLDFMGFSLEWEHR